MMYGRSGAHEATDVSIHTSKIETATDRKGTGERIATISIVEEPAQSPSGCRGDFQATCERRVSIEALVNILACSDWGLSAQEPAAGV